ncbi:MAG TPA: DUF4112 domain-containing protein [Pontibacter sp.]
MMEAQNTHYSRTPQSEKLRWVNHMVKLMDNQFQLPGTRFRFGLDPILGLLPVAGDLASFGISAMLVMTMARHGASGKVVTLMLLNIALDALIGSIPILGNVFDFFFKANQRNIRLLNSHYAEGKHQGSGKGIVAAVLIGIVLLFILLLWVLWELAEWVYGHLAGIF